MANFVIRIVALILIWAGATVAWFVLGATLLTRTHEANAAQSAALGSLWGPAQTQSAPTFTYTAKKRCWMEQPSRSRVDVELALDQRQKGLLWYSTYGVVFSGVYRVQDRHGASQLTFTLDLPNDGAMYDDVRVLLNGRPIEVVPSGGSITATVPIARGETTELSVAYRSRGMDQWSYSFGQGVNTARDFVLTMRTNFSAIDFPAGTLSPTFERKTPGGYQLIWQYRDLVAGREIGMTMPQRLQPGPLAQRITFWAPLSLLFYFFVMFIVITVRRIDLHPMNFFFLAAAFFSFHLLFAYTVDRMPIAPAFILCSAVSMFLTVTYLRVVVGLRFAALEAGLAQAVYLILFSLALFNEGSSGLTITVGAIITLFVTMQLTARIDWSRRFSEPAPLPAAAAQT